ncbi:sulfatase family protein [Thaumasiovibrio subtropicus]|uniref:sulfatase family protein n=1 Tax=Thaumasiovibrio subtropicus TaxID=1891207 RepID=UPI000B351A7C|nr:sulfatase-like hydrolase/transferase [Thaumasiovibrio subtropicus]
MSVCKLAFTATAILTSGAALAAIHPRADLETKPNVIVIYTDDQGWGDVGYHGFDDIHTPHIDALAAGGTYFTQAYVSASVCAPSRAGMLTGVYQQRMGIYGNFAQNHIPRSQPLMMEMMQSLGYKTGVVGKWHMGEPTGKPNERGADFFYGFHGGSHNYLLSDAEEGGKPWLSPLYRNTTPEPPIQESNGYLTELFTDEAVGFIERHVDQPFFLHLAHFAVHHPWQVPDGYIERLDHLEVHHEERRFFAAQSLVLDDGVGALMATLDKHNLTDNTLIFFMSDNGTPQGQGFEEPRRKQRGETTMSSPGPFNGFKGDTYEGGIRVPFIIHYPAQIPAGQVYPHMVSALDIMPTIAARFNYSLDADFNFDGVDLLPFLVDEANSTSKPHTTLYWRRDEDYAIRDGDWKLTWNDANGPQTIQLFNMANDPFEDNDLANTHSEIAQNLKDQFDAWEATLPINKLSEKPTNRNQDFDKGHQVNVKRFNETVTKSH